MEKTSGRQELRDAWRRGRVLFFWAFVFSIFVNLLMLTGPLYMLQVYDRVLTTRSVETLTALSALVVVLYLLMAVLDYARGRVMARIGARFQTHLDARLFDAVLRRSNDPRARIANTAALRDLDSLQALFLSPVLLAIMDMPWTPLFIAAIFMFHPMLGWLAVAGGIVIVVLTFINQSVSAHRLRLAQIATNEAHNFADKTQNASEIVLGQGMRTNMLRRYKRLRNEAQKQKIGANDWTGAFSSFTKSFRLFLQSAILGLGAFFVIKGQLTAGSMIACSILLGRALAPVEQAMNNWPVLQRARAGRKSLIALLANMPLIEPQSELPEPEAYVTAVGLAAIPPGGKTPIVRNVTFQIKPGQVLGVIGRSGAGKSSLARVLTGVWPIASGEVRLGGATLDQFNAEQLGKYIGYLPQSVDLFAGTIAENIRRMAIDADSRGVIKAAKQSNAHRMIMNLPNGYDTVLDGNQNLLSGGQRQRIGLARALYGDPVLLVLDEPNSMLDADGSDALNQAVRGFKRQGKSAIIMTHRPQAISECDLLMILDNGAVSTFGPREEVLKKMLPNLGKIRKYIDPRVT